MSVIPNDVLERARQPGASARAPARWVSALAEDSERTSARIAALVDRASKPVSAWIREGLADSATLGFVGLARWWAVEAVERSGFVPTDLADGALVVRRGQERAVVLGVPVVGAPDDDLVLSQLEDRLRSVFSGKRWALVVRRPLPPDLVVDKVIEPVRMWLASVERGKWDGDYAIYEDGGVSIELRVLAGPSGADHPRLRMRANDTERVIAEVGRQILSAVRDAADLDPRWPRIPVVARPSSRLLPRRRRFEALYGKLIEVLASSGPGARHDTHFTFLRGPTGLFGRSEMDQVGSVWWLHPSADDVLTWVGQAEENPWCRIADRGPAFPGERLALSMVGDAALGSPASMRRVKGP